MTTHSLRRICLVGVRGVGKTTLIRSAVLRELAGDDFRRFDHLPPAVKERYRQDAITWMEKRQAHHGKHILCDGHTSLLDESTGQVGPVFTERDCRFFRELILIEAPAETILQRRRADSSKRRSLDPAVVAAELRGERQSSQSIAEQWSMTLHRLPPNTDHRAAAALMEILSS